MIPLDLEGAVDFRSIFPLPFFPGRFHSPCRRLGSQLTMSPPMPSPELVAKRQARRQSFTTEQPERPAAFVVLDDDDEDEDNPDDEEELERAIALSLVNSTSDAPSTSAPSRAADAAHAEEARKVLKLMRGGEGVGGVMAQHLINAARQCGLGVIADDPANANLMVAYAIACRDAGTFSVDALQAVQHANLDGMRLDASDIANMLADVEQAVLPKRKKTRKAKS